jgi:hypothetical protein
MNVHVTHREILTQAIEECTARTGLEFVLFTDSVGCARAVVVRAGSNLFPFVVFTDFVCLALAIVLDARSGDLEFGVQAHSMCVTLRVTSRCCMVVEIRTRGIGETVARRASCGVI